MVSLSSYSVLCLYTFELKNSTELFNFSKNLLNASYAIIDASFKF